MNLKKITILLVSDSRTKVKRFRFPNLLLSLISVFIIFMAAFFFWIARDYNAMKKQMPRLAQLERENEHQKEQFLSLAQHIDLVKQKMVELKEFDRKLRIMVNLETRDDSIQNQGVGGSNPVLIEPRHSMAKTHRDLVRRMYHSLDNLDQEIAVGEQDKTELHKFLQNQKMLLAATPSIWPTRGWMSSRFGYRISPFTGKKEFHKGLDVATRMGAPIVASADGIISFVGWDGGYGKVLNIKHGYGLITKYAHLKKALVKKGQFVKRGETIALVGNTGRSTGPHLHYEVLLNGVAVNPLRYILN